MNFVHVLFCVLSDNVKKSCQTVAFRLLNSKIIIPTYEISTEWRKIFFLNHIPPCLPLGVRTLIFYPASTKATNIEEPSQIWTALANHRGSLKSLLVCYKQKEVRKLRELSFQKPIWIELNFFRQSQNFSQVWHFSTQNAQIEKKSFVFALVIDW